MKERDLDEQTRKTGKEEEARKKRIAERQALVRLKIRYDSRFEELYCLMIANAYSVCSSIKYSK